ncbi:hypothetical protein [Leucobacter celer]|uniref:hypothetical protein n=1 Tax=Leucobacter celer TaxID=668625 RepID=UPI0006A77C77|nr:hypothetical protein [Leucobacter celer]
MIRRTNRTGLAVAGIALCLAVLTGCSGAEEASGGAPSGQAAAPADAGEGPGETAATIGSVPLGELASVDGELAVGEEISVLVDTPEIEWEISNSNPDAVEIVDGGGTPRTVRLIARAAGESHVEFSGSIDGAADEILITVRG